MIEKLTPDLVTKGLVQVKAEIEKRRGVLAKKQEADALAGLEADKLTQLEDYGLQLALDSMPKVEARADDIVLFGREQAKSILILVANDRDERARDLAAITTMTFDERISASEMTTMTTRGRTLARIEANERLIAMAKDVGKGLLQALPYLLMFL